MDLLKNHSTIVLENNWMVKIVKIFYTGDLPFNLAKNAHYIISFNRASLIQFWDIVHLVIMF